MEFTPEMEPAADAAAGGATAATPDGAATEAAPAGEAEHNV